VGQQLLASSSVGRRVVTALAGVLAAAGSAALIQAPEAPAAGGIVAPGNPRVNDVICLTRCVAGRKATPGATVRVKGSALDYARTVVFRSDDGPVRARTTDRDGSWAKAAVPAGAISSRPYVVDFRGKRSNRSPHQLEVLPPSAIPEEIFPVRGPHQYWDGFGAGRGHDGMDIGARCGTALVSALAGRVQYRGYHGAAGYYTVIDTKGANTDLVYMHLLKPATVRSGQSVAAGQRIGAVGETGNASGCHLHFEYWVGDWYGGGRAVDPEGYLRAWDRKS
jgi:murein DD-endopeptidase MepM/ murein hydrolase activator NlpD